MDETMGNTRDEREDAIRLWFAMWLQQADMGIETLFAPDIVYTESWGPQYRGADKVKLWFEEWNTRGTVLRWDIKQFFHREDQTAVEWYFECAMQGGGKGAFDGMSLIRWTESGKIAALKEFACKIDPYDPYENGPKPRFKS